jgi:hypothetical protein
MDAPPSIFSAILGTPRATAQARLLSTADRDLAAVLSVASADDAALVLALVGPAKRKRLEEELARMRHVRLSPATIERISAHLAAHVAGDKPLGPASRYFKPVRDSD